MTTKNRYYLGIDGGGTQTRSLLADSQGRILGCGHAGSANRNHYSRVQVQAALQSVLQEALADLPVGAAVSVLFAGLGGVSTDNDRAEIAAILRELPEVGRAASIVVDNDTVVGLTGGLSGRPGLALVAGTGSACLGVKADRRRWLCGGWGALADDAGSAPWIGLRALQAAVQAEDGRLAPTALQQIVFDFLGLSEPRQMISRIHNHGLERADLGRLAPQVVKAAERGDRAAEMILRDAAAALSEMVGVTARQLFGEAGCEMILVGGLALSGPPFQPMLIDRISQDAPRITVHAPELSPVQGAVLEALRADGASWTPERLANLKAGCPKR